MLPPITIVEHEQRVTLAQAIVTLGRLLPAGMEVRFYRQPDDPRAVVESTYPNGEVTLHWFTNAMH
jgi:hypothetical protein